MSRVLKILRFLIPLNVFYILMAVHSVLHSPGTARLVPMYMLVVLLVNVFAWYYWDKLGLKRTPHWRRFLRFCAWGVLLILVPTLALIAVEEHSFLYAATMVYAIMIDIASFWLSNADFPHDVSG